MGIRNDHKYRALMAESLDLVCEIDSAGRFAFVGDNSAAVVGRDARELLGTEPLALVHPEDQSAAAKSLGSVRQKGACYCGPFRFRGRDDEWRWMEISAKALDAGSVVAVWRDVHDRVEVERTLREKDRRNRAIFDHSYQFFGLMDAQGTLLEANESALGFGGISRADVIGRPIWETHWFTINPETQTHLREAVMVAAQGDFVRYETEIRGADDSTMIIDFSIQPVVNPDGTIDLLVPEGRDITALKKAERVIREERDFGATVLDTAEVIVVVLDTDGRIVRTNRHLEEATGRGEEEIRGEKWIPLFIPERVRGLVAEGFQKALKEPLHSFVNTILTKNGGERLISWSTTPLRDANGQVTGVLSAGRDITQLKRAERAVREERDFVSQILDITQVVVAVLDTSGRIVRVNRHLEAVTGYREDKIVGEDWFSLFLPEETRDAAQTKFQEALTTPHLPYVSVFLTSSGEERLIEWRTEPLRDSEGHVTGLLGAGRDITDHTELERQFNQSQKMEAIGRLAGGVAHDFNNLLTAIGGSAELILNSAESGSPIARSAARIAAAKVRGEALTKQLLAFSRKQVTRPEIFDLNGAIRNAAELFGRMIGEDITIEWALAGESGSIEFDPAQFDQVVINLVVNARDAMPSGGRLAISTAREQVDTNLAHELDLTPGDYARLSIQDSGSGIPADVLPSIFDPFFTTKEPGKGTGLGLSTVLGIVKQHNGTIRVESEVGRGSTFALYFPRLESGSTSPPAPRAPGKAEAPVDAKTILVVEDDGSLRELIGDVLKDAGYRILEAGSPRRALECVEQHGDSIDLVITDVVMPGLSAVALCREMASRHPGTAVLFMSGYTDRVLADQGLLSEEAAFLRKPFATDELLAVVRNLLDKS